MDVGCFAVGRAKRQLKGKTNLDLPLKQEEKEGEICKRTVSHPNYKEGMEKGEGPFKSENTN